MGHQVFRRKPAPTDTSDERREPVKVDGDLRNRIRFLLTSHIEKGSPATPSPIPAGAYTTAKSDEEDIGVSSGTSNPCAAHARLAPLRKADPELFAHTYDGPAGQVPESPADGPRRRSTQSGIAEALGSEGDGPQSVPTTEKASAGSNFSRNRHSLREPPKKSDADGPRRVRSTLTKAPTKPRQSLYNLKATSSADSQVADQQLKRPAQDTEFRINHVPGSFRSEYDASIRASRTPSPATVNDFAPATVEPLQRRSFEAVSSRGVSNTIAPSSNQSPSQTAEVQNNQGRPDTAVPFLRPKLSSYTIREAPSVDAVRDHPAPQPISLRNVIDRLEGPLPDLDLIQAVEATSNDALTPDLGAKSAVAAIDLQTPAPSSTSQVTVTHAAMPEQRGSLLQDRKATAGLSEMGLRPSNEQLQDSHASTSGATSMKTSAASRSLRQLSPSPISEDQERNGERSRTLNTSSRSTKSSQQLTHPEPEPDTNANWMRQLLGRKSAPAIGQAPPNLTARPRHRSRKVTEDVNLQRSSTVPAQGNRAPEDPDQPKGPETFARVITDLEGLLQQALQMAGHANDKTIMDDVSVKPFSPSQTFKTAPRYPEARETSFSSSSSSDEGTSSDSPGLDEEQNRTTIPLKYRSRNGEHVTLVEPDEADRYHSEFKSHRHATPYPSASRRSSGNPPVVVEAQDEHSQRESGRERSRTLAIPESQIYINTTARSPHQPFQVTIQGEPADVQNVLLKPIGGTSSSVDTADWALKKQPTTASRRYHESIETPSAAQIASSMLPSAEDSQGSVLRERRPSKTAAPAEVTNPSVYSGPKSFSSGDDKEPIAYFSDRPASQLHKRGASQRKNAGQAQLLTPGPTPWEDTLSPLPSDIGGRGPGSDPKSLDLRHRHHFSLREPKMFSLDRSHKRSPIARDWSISKKRWVALVACINTALMGLIIGIYAGEVPAIQYNIVDEHHYTILGNVVLFIGLAITTSIFWPLPLLFGRKPFTLAALAILVPLQFPQAVAVSAFRTPYTPTYRVALLLSRAVAGLVMGFANINFIATLLDLFGSSLQSVNPHQEIVNANDVRRHGGGMGIWLGVWTWCFIGSIGVGFFIGAVIISGLPVDWGFWITIILTAFVLVLNVLVPEVRRSPYRRSVAEVRTPTELSRRVARGEVKMHLYSTGPKWWMEEVIAGSVLCVRMLKQPGFLVLSTYIGWIYGQIVMIIVVCHLHRVQ